MPWTEADVDRHYKGLDAKQKRQWCHVANGALDRGDDDGTAIRKANGAVNNSKNTVEALLYIKARTMLEAVRMQEAAKILMEADPKPRVEKDHRGMPVVPNGKAYQDYFDFMQASHIKTAMMAARQQWAHARDEMQKRNAAAEADRTNADKAAAARFAAAHVKALGMEVAAAQSSLKKKEMVAKADAAKKAKKSDARRQTFHSAVTNTADALTGGSPLARMIAHHAANRMFGKKHDSFA